MGALFTELEPIVRETREMLMPHWGSITPDKKKTDAAYSVVTELDLVVERHLKDALARIDPSAEFAGEEYGGTRDAKRFWLCDPIDGTGHFIRGLPFCSVMLALIEEGSVNAAIIYDFVKDDLYHAERGKGAYQNSEPIHVSDRELADSYIAFESRIENDANLATMQKLRRQMTLCSSITSGFEHVLVASGKYDARIALDPYGKDWDFAPGSLLIEEAGGVVANIGSQSYDYRNLNMIAANPRVFEALTSGPDAPLPVR